LGASAAFACATAFGVASDAQPTSAHADRTIVVTRIGSRDMVDT
jgi:hypothetical protein